MFLLTAPSDHTIRQFIAAQRDLPYTYAAVGSTRDTPPPGYNVDRNRIKLGSGPATYQQAIGALQRWEMFNIGWVRLCWPAMPEVGTAFAVLIRHLGFWSLNSTRLVYLEEQHGPVQRYSFAYGTLPGHAESGEERFSIEWHHNDDSVWYEIFAFSRPRHVLAWAGYPITRLLQKRFTRDSKAVMARAVGVR